MKAGLDGDGKVVDPVAFKRFTKGVKNIEAQLMRLLKQRASKLSSSKGVDVDEYIRLIDDDDDVV